MLATADMLAQLVREREATLRRSASPLYQEGIQEGVCSSTSCCSLSKFRRACGPVATSIGRILAIASETLTLDRIFEKHARELMAYLCGLTKCEATAEDALQAVFVELAKRLDRLGNVTKLRAYLFAMARNEAMNLLGRVRREKDLGARAVLPLVEPAPDAVEKAEEIERLNAALHKLSDEQREVVILKCVEGFTFAEIGELLNIPLNTAASRYRYAIEGLRELMEKEK